MNRSVHFLLLLLTGGLVSLHGDTVLAVARSRSGSEARQPASTAKIKKELFAGRVVMLRDALKRRGIKSTDEFTKLVVLERTDGELIPIVPDWRGRAFYQDKRLRNRPVELVGYRRDGVPFLQVLMIFTIDRPKSPAGTKTTNKAKPANGKTLRQYFDYWCDICSIPMYEIKQCECCQGPIRMRFQPRSLPSYLTNEPKNGDRAK